MPSQASQAFARIDVRVPSGPVAERVAAEAYAAGAVGLEERSCGGGVMLVLYASRAAAPRVWRAVRAVAPADAVAEPEAVVSEDWPELWKRGLEPCVISPRLVVRPSFVDFAPAPGQTELCIDPGQAFGTGGHESTQLALEWIDALAESLTPGLRLLDLGCGSGVLALAALALGGGRAVACDLDPLAAEATRANARANGLADRLAVFVGSVDALRPECFDWVVANLLRRELEEVLEGLARCLRPGGRAILSGLLESEADAVGAAVSAAGLRPTRRRQRRDASGTLWSAWLTSR